MRPSYFSIVLILVILLTLISGCATLQSNPKNNENPKQAAKQETSPQNNIKDHSAENVPQTALIEECRKYPWPPDCSWVPDEEGIEFCKKCKELGVGSDDSFKSSENPSSQPDRSGLSFQWSLGKCQGNGPVKLGASPLKLSDLGSIEPMGAMISAHVTPVDHQYWHPTVSSNNLVANPERYEVYAPADGYIVVVEHSTRAIVDGDASTVQEDDYRIVFEHSCTFYTLYIHVNKIKDEILNQVDFKSNQPGHFYASTRIPVKEGELIGRTGEHQIDFAVISTNVTLKGFVNPDNYKREPWKIHTFDPFEYFKEPLRSQLMEKNLRTAEPLGGKIDYDIDGRLAGNWFKEGTKGYEGINLERYWDGHLTFAYDYLDPSQIRISTGDFEGRSEQFGVRNNAPDPASISLESGPVKYELVPFEHFIGDSGQVWDKQSYAQGIKAKNDDSNLKGTIMVQLIQDRKLKVEIFPGKKASEVSGFTNAAKAYER